MAVDITKLQTHKKVGNKEEFNNILTGFLPHLRNLVRHKLRHMELNGEVPRNMYSAQGVVDDVYLKVFENFAEDFSEPEKLKIKMYAAAREVLNDIREKNQPEKVSVETLLKNENKELEEEYTIDADGDLVMLEDLDDISYHLDEYKERIILLENEQVGDLTKSFELAVDDNLTDRDRKRIGKAYMDLPELTRSVVDHFAFAGLTEVQIAEIHQIPLKTVQEIIEKVKVRFGKMLD